MFCPAFGVLTPGAVSLNVLFSSSSTCRHSHILIRFTASDMSCRTYCLRSVWPLKPLRVANVEMLTRGWTQSPSFKKRDELHIQISTAPISPDPPGSSHPSQSLPALPVPPGPPTSTPPTTTKKAASELFVPKLLIKTISP